MSSVPAMNCLVCGIPDTTRHIFSTLDDTCSPCFAWYYNYLEALMKHDETGVYPDIIRKLKPWKTRKPKPSPPETETR